MFGKLNEHSKINENGIGLGLTICKKLCEQMKGAISVESEDYEGSTFTFKV